MPKRFVTKRKGLTFHSGAKCFVLGKVGRAKDSNNKEQDLYLIELYDGTQIKALETELKDLDSKDYFGNEERYEEGLYGGAFRDTDDYWKYRDSKLYYQATKL